MQPHRRQPTRLPHPWDSLGKNTGLGCHFLLQCVKAKSEIEVAQSCPIQRLHGLQPNRLLHPWDFPGKSTGVGCHCLILGGIKIDICVCSSVCSVQLFVTSWTSPPGSSLYRIFQARKLEWVASSFSRGSSQPRDWTHISCVSCISRWVLDHLGSIKIGNQ